MADRERSEALDELVDRVLAAPAVPLDVPDPELGDLARIAATLRDLPREGFRTRLRADLERMATMTAPTTAATATYIAEGLASVTPYVIVRDADAAITFYRHVFDATELFRHRDPTGRIAHAKLRIGSSVVEIGEHADVHVLDADRQPQAMAMHLYVEDVDAVLARAADRGAQVQPAEEQPYGDREGGVVDPFGIVWYVATHISGTDRPAPPAGSVGFGGLTPYLHYEDGAAMLGWLARVFGFEERARYVDADGTVSEAEMLAGHDEIWMAGHGAGYWDQQGRGPEQLILVWVDDVDAHHARVTAAGVDAEPPEDKPYGVRTYGVTDPEGYQWGFMQRLSAGFVETEGGLREILPDHPSS